MAHAQDYWTLKKAYTAIDSDNLPLAFDHFLSCKRTAKISFNLAVLSLWLNHPKHEVTGHLLDALDRDPYLAIAAFYLGCLDSSIDAFRQSLRGFRNCCTFIDYTAVGLPFRLEREDVLYNLVSLQPTPSDPSDLRLLSIQSISSLLLNQLDDNAANIVQLKMLPWNERKMIFRLLPAIEPEPLELKGPEHVSLIEGETEYFSAFPDAHHRQIKLKHLESINNKIN